MVNAIVAAKQGINCLTAGGILNPNTNGQSIKVKINNSIGITEQIMGQITEQMVKHQMLTLEIQFISQQALHQVPYQVGVEPTYNFSKEWT
jgi:hypothetical protein